MKQAFYQTRLKGAPQRKLRPVCTQAHTTTKALSAACSWVWAPRNGQGAEQHGIRLSSWAAPRTKPQGARATQARQATEEATERRVNSCVGYESRLTTRAARSEAPKGPSSGEVSEYGTGPHSDGIRQVRIESKLTQDPQQVRSGESAQCTRASPGGDTTRTASPSPPTQTNRAYWGADSSERSDGVERLNHAIGNQM